jgi:TetR/AcrR family fatty acid metabolism transcriptional regulator
MERFSTTALRQYLGIIRDVIAEGQAAGGFRKDVNPTFAAKLFFGMLDEMATNWILSKRKYSLMSEAEPIADLFIRGLAVTPTARGRR